MLGVVALILAIPTTSDAQEELQGVFTEESLRDAIVGRRELTEGERALFDVNEDGVFDSADLVALLTSLGLTPRAAFEASTSESIEGAGAVVIPLVFTREFRGVVDVRVNTARSTAQLGVDFEFADHPGSDTAAIPVDGVRGEVALTLFDDLDLEALESIVLEILPGDGYEPGAPDTHQLNLDENDALWVGSIERGESLLGFDIRIATDGVETTMELIGADGTTIPPSGLEDDAWPAAPNATTFTDSVFSTVFENIAVPLNRSERFGTAFGRTLRFDAEAPPENAENPNVFDPAFGIEGTYTEEIVPLSPAFRHLGRTESGPFILRKVPLATDVPSPQLEASP